MTSPYLTADDRRRLARHFPGTVAGAGSIKPTVADRSRATSVGNGTSSKASPLETPLTDADAVIDADALNVLLKMQYVQAQLGAFATYGTSISAIAGTVLRNPGASSHADSAGLFIGTGVQDTVTGGRSAEFANATVAQHAREIVADDLAQLRSLHAMLGSRAVAQPTLNIASGVDGAFTRIARLAGFTAAHESFDPYASDLNYLLASLVLKDLAVTAMKGACAVIRSVRTLDAVAGMLTTQAYHAGLIRTTLYMAGQLTAFQQFTRVFDALNRSTNSGRSNCVAGTIGLTPTDLNGHVCARTAAQVLDLLALTGLAVSAGAVSSPG